MRADLECFECCRKKAEGLMDQYMVSDHVRNTVSEHVNVILSEASGTDVTAPALMADVISEVEKYVEISHAYDEPKRKYNSLLLGREERIRREVEGERDHFLAGIQCAITGNYIDFGAMSDVHEEKLNELLENRRSIQLDEKELQYLKKDLEHGKRLAYITDNAGEIVLDKIFIRELRCLYPQLEIAVIVRGCPTLNDATYEDALSIGMEEYARIIPNGTNVPGTPLEMISDEAARWIDSSDLCIAKGQGNFETLRGCGRNVYYLFLCKCQLFTKKFGAERFTPILANEKRLVQYA